MAARSRTRKRWLAALAALLALAFCAGAGAAERPQAYIMKVEGGISQALAEAIKRKITAARDEGVQTFILEFDTPGGYVDASMDLADFILASQDEIDIIAYVHPSAYSGGTMVALACKTIYIDETLGRMGDVAPIDPSGEIQGPKIQSPIIERMTSYARARGYPEALVEGMVNPDLEVWRVQMQDEPEGSYHYIKGSRLNAMTEEERAKIVSKDLIVGQGELLTIGAEKAVEYGFATAVGSPEELFDELELARGRVARLYLTGSEKLLAFLDMLSPFLIAAGFVLIFIEISHPGFGLPGVLGIGCFAAFFMIKWTLHYARLLEVLLFVAGIALLVVEVLFIPGFGVVGAAGIGLIFISLVLMFQEFSIPETPRETIAFQYNVLKVIGSLAGAAVGIMLMLRALPSLPGLSRLVHQADLAAAHAGEGVARRTPGLEQMVGEVGVALTALRPAGRAEFGDRLLDVVTEGEFIEKGARVRVEQVHGNRIVVEPYQGF